MEREPPPLLPAHEPPMVHLGHENATIAPPGICAYCDHRREVNKKAAADRRARVKNGD